MLETSNSDLDVDRVMYKIRETVARERSSADQTSSTSASRSSLTGKSRSFSEGDPASLRRQSKFLLRHDDRYHINDFLKYHGEDFVRNAYRAILKRDPDSSGWTECLQSLASGRFDKLDILVSLRYSTEGKRAQAKVGGLALPATIRRVERVPIIGYILRVVIAVGRMPHLLRHLRRSEFYFLTQQEQIVEHINQVHKQLAEALAQVSGQTLAVTEKAANQEEVLESLFRQANDEQREFRDGIEARLTAVQKHMDQHTEALTSRVEEKMQHVLDRQQQLAQQMEGETQGLLRRQQQTHAELVMQERRLTSLLKEAREHPPGGSQSYLDLLANEEDHLLDPLYASFEDQFRGDREEVRNRLKVYLPIIKNAGVAEDALDIGCGRGEWLELLRGEGVQAGGVDHNRVFVEQCRQIGLEVMEEDALVYLRSLTGNSLNAITSFHLVEHLAFEELIELLDEVVRTLRSGGLLILETPNPENFMVGSCSFYADPTHRNPIPSATLKFLLESRGLSHIEVMKLRPRDDAKIEGNTEIVKRFNEYFYGAPDYGIIGWKN